MINMVCGSQFGLAPPASTLLGNEEILDVFGSKSTCGFQLPRSVPSGIGSVFLWMLSFPMFRRFTRGSGLVILTTPKLSQFSLHMNQTGATFNRTVAAYISKS
jgi:hypothetical protein